ncbi:Protein FAR-RED IMPAIRED RESPONSE 1 [Bienertia sinuspersici]
MVVEVDEEDVVGGEGLPMGEQNKRRNRPMDSQNVDSPLSDGVFTNEEGDDIVPPLSDGVFTNEEVDDIAPPPEISMNFKTWGDVETMYKRDIKKNKERRKISKEMGIGGSSVVKKPKVRKRRSKKCDCKAYLYAGVNAVSRFWEIKNVTLEHTGHTPIPIGVPINQIHDSLARERDGLENMPVNEKDMRHVADKERKLKLEEGDAMALIAYDEIKKNLKRVVYNSFTAKEFEVHWKEMIIKFGLEKNSWLAKLFDDRSMWVPAYMRDKFWAGMRTTQRVESIHSFFDKYINSTTKLVEFGEKYTAAVEKKICQERKADDSDRKWHRDTVKRGDNIQNWCDVMIEKACVSNGRESTVIDMLKKVLVDLDSIPAVDPQPEDVVHEPNSQSPVVWPSNFHVTQTIRDPVVRKKRGRPKKGSKMKSVAEEAEQSTSEDTEADEALFRSERKVTRSMTTNSQRRKKTSKKNLATLLDEELEKLSTYERFGDLDDTSNQLVSF